MILSIMSLSKQVTIRACSRKCEKEFLVLFLILSFAAYDGGFFMPVLRRR